MKLDITTPEEHLGDFVGDLQQRRAIIHKTENRGKLVFIEAHAPLAELFGYSSAMRSLSQGRAGCSMEPLNYAPAPPGGRARPFRCRPATFPRSGDVIQAGRRQALTNRRFCQNKIYAVRTVRRC